MKRLARFVAHRGGFFWPVGATVAAYVTHVGVLSGGFNWLDQGDIEGGRAILPLDRLVESFTGPFGTTGFYRPLVTITLSLDHALYGSSAMGYHLTNLLLGCAVVLGSYFLGRTFFALSVTSAGLASLVIAVHPLTWLPFGAISYRPELLVMLLATVSVSLYVRSRRRERPPWGAALCFYGALLSKESAIVWVPLLCGMWELMLGADARGLRDRLRLWRRAVSPLLLMAAVAVLYLVQRFSAVGAGWRLAHREMSLSEAIGTRLAVLGRRLADLGAIDPPPLSDATTIVSLGHPSALLTLALILAGMAFVAHRGIGDREARPVLYLVVALLPASNLVPLPRFSSPHYSFFALPALAVGVALAWERVSSLRASPLLRGFGALLVVAWIATMAVSTYAAGNRFRDDRALFAPEVQEDPGFREGWHYLGTYYYENRNLGAAAAAFERALEPDPARIAYVDVPSARIDLAICRLEQGRVWEAEMELRRAAEEAPPEMQSVIRFNRALVALHANRPDLVRKRLGPLAQGLEGNGEELLARVRARIEAGSR